MTSTGDVPNASLAVPGNVGKRLNCSREQSMKKNGWGYGCQGPGPWQLYGCKKVKYGCTMTFFSRPSTASSVSKRERGVSMRLERPSSRSSSLNGVLYLVGAARVSRGFGNLVQSEVGMNCFAEGVFIPGGGLRWVLVELVSSGPVLQVTLASVSVAGVFGGAPGSSPASAAGSAAHFLLSVRTCHQASISFSSSFGRLGAGWRWKTACCSTENLVRTSSHGVPLTTSLHVMIVSPRVRLLSRIITYCTRLLASLHRPP